MTALRIAMFGSSLVSSYWNGAATYYRGIVLALAARGHRITFYEPDIYERQGRALLHANQKDAALAAYQQALTLRPQNPALKEILRTLRGEDSSTGTPEAFVLAPLLKEKNVPHIWHVDEHAHDFQHWKKGLYNFCQLTFKPTAK